MRHTVAVNETFIVYAPRFFSTKLFRSLLRLEISKGLRWWVLHKPSGTAFQLTSAEHRRIDELADNLRKLPGSSSRDASELLLRQVDVFWKERTRKQQYTY
jgi:hypothetical protein